MKTKLLFPLAAALVFTGCHPPQNTTLAPASKRIKIPVQVVETKARLHVLEMKVEGHAPLKDKITSLDLGILKTTAGDQLQCKLLSPRRGTWTSKQPWAPFDFYTNVLNEEEQAEARNEKKLGEADIFFVGDNNNRNGETDPHTWTLRPSSKFSSSLTFSERAQGRDWVSFYIKFQRGPKAKPLKFEALINTEIRAVDGECVATAYLCDDVEVEDGVHFCEDHDWTRQIHSIAVVADYWGVAGDVLRSPAPEENEKNDVKEVYGLVSDVDENGDAVGEPYRERLAVK